MVSYSEGKGGAQDVQFKRWSYKIKDSDYIDTPEVSGYKGVSVPMNRIGLRVACIVFDSNIRYER